MKMCGIFGTNLNIKNQIQLELERLKHRGPDYSGFFNNDNVSLGHTRLSIIDVSNKSHQPFFNKDKQHIMVYNGEVYNYQEIKELLETKGYNFLSDGDTEVVLTSFIEYGSKCLDMFNGMFSFCIYNIEKNEFFLARDKIGIKQLYYFHDQNTGVLIFSSEYKPILSILKQQKYIIDLNPAEISYYLQYKSYSQNSLFNKIKILKPGQYLIFKNNDLVVKSYYDISEKISHFSSPSLKEQTEVLDELLNESVRKRLLIADVPTGVVCSGGLDSSLIAAVSKKYKPNVSAFFVDVIYKGYSELEFAKQIVEKYDLKLFISELNADIFKRDFVNAIYHNEMPLVHPNSIGIYLVSKLARKNNHKVLLTGEGADELFGGYTGRYTRYSQFNQNLKLLKITNLMKKKQLIKIYLSNFLLDSALDYESLRALKFGNLYNSSVERNIDRELNRYKRNNPVERRMINDIYDYLQPILLRQDKMSMMASIESRVPFLDTNIVEFALNLPLKYKINRKSEKVILRNLAKKYLPKSIINRKKMGFALPIREWLGFNLTIFDDGFLQEIYDFNAELFEEQLHANYELYWMLLNLEITGRIFYFEESIKKINNQLFI